MAQIMTTETVRTCPLCDASEFTKDYKRAELYCNKCGLVLQSAIQYVGLEKISNVIPFSPPFESNMVRNTDKAKIDNRRTTTYKHNLTNKQLMKYGKK